MPVMQKFKRVLVALSGALFLGMAAWGACQIDWAGSRGNGCAFCSEHILEAQTVYKGPLASLLVTHKPAVKGHVLIIPNRHVETYDELTLDEMAAMGELVQKTRSISEKILGTKDYFLLQKNGRLAGQTVPHVHIHFVPRDQSIGELSFLVRFFTSPILKPISGDEMTVWVNELSAEFRVVPAEGLRRQ